MFLPRKSSRQLLPSLTELPWQKRNPRRPPVALCFSWLLKQPGPPPWLPLASQTLWRAPAALVRAPITPSSFTAIAAAELHGEDSAPVAPSPFSLLQFLSLTSVVVNPLPILGFPCRSEVNREFCSSRPQTPLFVPTSGESSSRRLLALGAPRNCLGAILMTRCGWIGSGRPLHGEAGRTAAGSRRRLISDNPVLTASFR